MDEDHPPKHYLLAHVREALATDPRVNELHIDTQVAGNRVVLTGYVATEERKALITEVVKELLPEYEIHNQTTVGTFPESAGEERI